MDLIKYNLDFPVSPNKVMLDLFASLQSLISFPSFFVNFFPFSLGQFVKEDKVIALEGIEDPF